MKNLFRTKVSIAFCKRLLFFAIIFVTFAGQSFAQFCTGSISYTLRDETGAQMSYVQLEKLSIKQIAGYEAVAKEDEQGRIFYRVDDRGQTIMKIPLTNPLVLADTCGVISSLMLEYAGKTMTLLFENRDSWTRFNIDSLPFQAGMFRLKKISDGNGQRLRCDEVKAARPSIRSCTVNASDWLTRTETGFPNSN